MAQDKKSGNEEDENNKIDVEYHVAPPEEEEESNLKGDYRNVAILLFLYILQGIPLGISSAVRILLQNRGVSYKEQALFSLAAYPFTMKVLWCPIVDALYLKRFGRRKSWLVPVQILIGAFMIILSLNVNEWLGDGEGNQPQIVLLTVVFFILWFLTATQDIVVDGWCLTMLQRRNVGYAATTNSCGQTGGWFIGYVILLVFESPEFCNKYIFSEPRTEGLITLAGFLKFWGVVFLITTVLIALFKKERSELDYELEEHPDYGVKKAYPILWEIVKLKPVLKLSLVLLTAKAGFAACDVVTSLKLIEYGMPKEKAALLAIPLVPIQLVLPFIISRYTAGPRPMNFYIKAFPYRLLMTIVIGLFVFFTPIMKTDDGFPFYFYALLVCIYMVYQIPFRSMYICDMSFFAKISDPLIGGTYMTLMNTITNLGGSWVQTFFLWFVDVITWRRCIFDEELLSSNSTSLPLDNKCSDKIQKEICTKSGGKCHTDIEGYYIEIGINVVYGIVWFFLVKNLILYLQSLPAKDWYVLSRKEEQREMVQVSKDK